MFSRRALYVELQLADGASVSDEEHRWFWRQGWQEIPRWKFVLQNVRFHTGELAIIWMILSIYCGILLFCCWICVLGNQCGNVLWLGRCYCCMS